MNNQPDDADFQKEEIPMLQKEAKLSITFSVDTTELDEAIKKMKELLELQEKVKSNSYVGVANE